MSESISITGIRTQEVVCVRTIPYSFKDKETGKAVNGETVKVCFLEYTDGNLSGMFICKAAAGFNPPLKQRGVLTFDRYGRANGFTPARA